MFYQILDKKRREILPLFVNFKNDFYLAGGTALALQLGHRDSVDFDFFSETKFSTEKLFEKISAIFHSHKLKKTQQDQETLTFVMDDNIKISFFYYPYKLVKKLIDEPFFKIAGLIDVGCMKLSAIVGRPMLKDYVDLYFILKKIPLDKLLPQSEKKYPSLDYGLVLKSLVYFEDIQKERLKFRNNSYVSFSAVKKELIDTVKKVSRKSYPRG